jgi:nucleotide-binding universal stress UspA family protein
MQEQAVPFVFRKILVPLDGSPCAESALGPALAIAEAMKAELVLFRVAQPIPRTQALIEMPDVYNEVVAAAYREAGDYLSGLKDTLQYDRISVDHEPVQTGVARQIVDYCTAHEVDLIVMSSHGYTGVRRWARGSVAEKVLNGCTCATLVVRCMQGAEPEE